MICATVNSSVLFDANINPTSRFDAAFGIAVAAMSEQRIDVLQKCFRHLFTNERQAKIWVAVFLNAKTGEEAELQLSKAFGFKSVASIPTTMQKSLHQLKDLILEENISKLKAKKRDIDVTISRLQAVLGKP